MNTFINKVEEGIISLLLASMTLLVFMEVLMRFGFNVGIHWAQELTLLLSGWLVMFGVSYGIKVGSHIGVDALVRLFSANVRRTISIVAILLCLIYCGLFLVGSWVYLGKLKSIGIHLEDIPVPKWIANSILFGGMIMLAVTSFYLFSLNLVLMVLLVLPIMAIGRKVRRLSRESQDRIADTSALAGEILNAMPTVQACTQERQEAKRFSDRTETSFVTAIRRTRVRAALTALIITAVMGTIIFVLWVGARQVHEGVMTGGELASFVLYAALVAGGVGTMAEVWGDVMRAAGATERLLDLLHAESAIREQAETVQPSPAAQVGIRLDHVVFAYPGRPQIRALDDICLDIRPGERVALVGPSGAGKTSLFQLLLRYYEVTGGSVLINDQDIRTLSLHDLRKDIAIVPQDPVIFSANALENIRYGRMDATDEEVMQAARAALVDEFIGRLPEGYQTFLGERG
ncbi:MAG: hypothetical protein CVU63_13240, partial [Deltaproteobacteria bacterium HGW-Deltaproteobacteria-20]